MKKLMLLQVFICFSIFFSCQEKESRKPISKSSGNYINSSIELNKTILKDEETVIGEYISKDSINEYMLSSNGFWYSYNKRNIRDSIYPKKGDLVEFEYEIEDLDKNTLYSKNEIGTNNYIIDEEDIIIGLRNGLKLMKKEENVTFIFPSHLAYRYTGDHNKIGTNQPIVVKVQMININNN